MDDKKNVYITLHKNFVHEGIEYEDGKDRRDQDLQLGDAAQGHRGQRTGCELQPVQPPLRESVSLQGRELPRHSTSGRGGGFG